MVVSAWRWVVYVTLCDPMDCSPPGSSLSMEFSRQEYWSRLPFSSPGHLPNPEIEPASLMSPALAVRFFTTEPPGFKRLTHWKRTWCRERLKAGEEGDDRGWDGWMASLTQRAWVWEALEYCEGQPGVLQYMALQSWTQLSDWTTTPPGKPKKLTELTLNSED